MGNSANSAITAKNELIMMRTHQRASLVKWMWSFYESKIIQIVLSLPCKDGNQFSWMLLGRNLVTLLGRNLVSDQIRLLIKIFQWIEIWPMQQCSKSLSDRHISLGQSMKQLNKFNCN